MRITLLKFLESFKTLLIVGFILHPSLCFSVDDSARIFNMTLEELLNTELTIASRNKTPLNKSPSSVTLFTHQDISNLGVRTLTELLAYVPGFYSMYNSVEGNESHLVMRGHAQKYANTLLVLLNGQRLNDDYTGGISYLTRFINLRDAKRVEVIRGPGSALYGSNAYTGVVNIITELKSEASIEFGTLGETSVYWSNNLKVDDWRIGASLNLYKDSGDDFYEVFDPNALQSTTRDPRKVNQISLQAHNQSSQLNFQFLSSNREDYYQFRRLADGITELDLNHWIVYGSHKAIDNAQWTLELSAGYQQAKRESLGVLVPGGEPPFVPADFLFGLDLDYKSANLGVDASYRYTEDMTFNIGTFFSTSQVPNAFLKSNYDLFGDLSFLNQLVGFAEEDQQTVIEEKRMIKSVYLQNEWDVTDKIIVTSGLRYDTYNDIDNALTPRLSLVHQLTEEHGYKLIYGRAYRAPSLGDLYDDESGLTVGNKSLIANEITTFEIVYFWNNSNYSVTTTLFDNDQKNIIAFRTDENNNSFLDNLASNKAQGIELEWSWFPSEQWHFKTAITHLFENNTRLGVSENFPASEDISPQTYINYTAQFSEGPWMINLSGSWRDKVEVLMNNGSLFLLNAHLKYHWYDDWSLSLNVRNLADQKYNTSSFVSLGTDSNDQNVQQFPQRGRQIMLQLSHSF